MSVQNPSAHAPTTLSPLSTVPEHGHISLPARRCLFGTRIVARGRATSDDSIDRNSTIRVKAPSFGLYPDSGLLNSSRVRALTFLTRAWSPFPWNVPPPFTGLPRLHVRHLPAASHSLEINIFHYRHSAPGAPRLCLKYQQKSDAMRLVLSNDENISAAQATTKPYMLYPPSEDEALAEEGKHRSIGLSHITTTS